MFGCFKVGNGSWFNWDRWRWVNNFLMWYIKMVEREKERRQKLATLCCLILISVIHVGTFLRLLSEDDILLTHISSAQSAASFSHRTWWKAAWCRSGWLTRRGNNALNGESYWNGRSFSKVLEWDRTDWYEINKKWCINTIRAWCRTSAKPLSTSFLKDPHPKSRDHNMMMDRSHAWAGKFHGLLGICICIQPAMMDLTGHARHTLWLPNSGRRLVPSSPALWWRNASRSTVLFQLRFRCFLI